MFTPFHILWNSNRITLWQLVICGIPSFQFEDFLFPLSPSYKKDVSVFSSPGGLIPEALQVFRADLCEGPDKAEQGLVEQAWGSKREGLIRKGIHWCTLLLKRPISTIPRKTYKLFCTACAMYTGKDPFLQMPHDWPLTFSTFCSQTNYMPFSKACCSV